MQFDYKENFAHEMDEKDPLRSFRERFLIPRTKNGKEVVYLVGNSLGLQPKKAGNYIQQELEDWANLGVRGHMNAKNPWYAYHELVTESLAKIVGAKPHEVVAMNSLTTNLHLMMVSFYRPTSKKFKIVIEPGAFPSDQYAVTSQIKFHGFDPKEALLEIDSDNILETLKVNGDAIALVMIGNVNFRTGEAFDIKGITKVAHQKNCMVGFDLAHGAGNLSLKLHDDGPDFAVWCNYKYLNGGPGTIGGCFVHERHASNPKLPRFAGWWGYDKTTRFELKSNFVPMQGIEGWQLSNPPIFQLAALRASMEIFDDAGMDKIFSKRDQLTAYLEFCLNQLPKDYVQILTPKNPKKRGCQLSFRIQGNPSEIVKNLDPEGFFCDFREPDILRVAPVPLYNRFHDVFSFAKKLEGYAQK